MHQTVLAPGHSSFTHTQKKWPLNYMQRRDTKWPVGCVDCGLFAFTADFRAISCVPEVHNFQFQPDWGLHFWLEPGLRSIFWLEPGLRSIFFTWTLTEVYIFDLNLDRNPLFFTYILPKPLYFHLLFTETPYFSLTFYRNPLFVADFLPKTLICRWIFTETPYLSVTFYRNPYFFTEIIAFIEPRFLIFWPRFLCF